MSPIVQVFATGTGGHLPWTKVTAALKYEMDIGHVLLDNSQLGRLSKERRASHWGLWQISVSHTDLTQCA
jgi:pyruvate oxidase